MHCHMPWTVSLAGGGGFTHKSTARRATGAVKGEGQVLHSLMVTQCEFGKSPTEICGALGVQPALTWEGEKGLELCASDPATCGDSRHQKPVLRVSGCGGCPCRGQRALPACCVMPKLGVRCLTHSCASKIKQVPQGTSSTVGAADGHGGTRKPNPVVSTTTSALLNRCKGHQSHPVPARGAVQPSRCSRETQHPRDTPSLLGPGHWGEGVCSIQL